MKNCVVLYSLSGLFGNMGHRNLISIKIFHNGGTNRDEFINFTQGLNKKIMVVL